MKLLRHKRTGRLVVYDESLLSLGTYEPYEEPAKEEPVKPEAKKKKKPGNHDEVNAGDEISVTLVKATKE